MASATLLILGGLGLMRSSAFLWTWVRYGPLRVVLFLFHDNDNVYLRKMPEDFVFALVLIALGCALLTVVVRGPSAESGSGSAPIRSRGFERLDVIVVVLFPLLSLAVFLALWAWTLIERPVAVVVFLAIVLVPAILICRRDLRDGIRLGFSMSKAEIGGLVGGTLAVLALTARGLNSWKFSFIGDEYAFLIMGSHLAKGRWSEIPWLSAHGVYDQLPVAMSAWQSIWIRLLGSPVNVSWRFSSCVLMALCLPPLYLTLRHLLGRATPDPRLSAAMGCGFFGLSEYIVDRARIGNACTGFVPPLIFAGCFFLAALSRRSRALFFLAGLTCGLGAYLTSLGAAIPMVILPAWLLLDVLTARRGDRRFVRDVVLPLACLGAGFLVAAAPLFMQLSYWQELIKLNVSSKEAAEHRHLWLAKTFQGTFAFLHYRAWDHFLWKNVIDPVTAFWAAAGLGMARFLGLRRFGLLVLTLVGVAFLCGGISQYEYPPITRMLVILYPVSMLAAAGFAGLTSGSRGLRLALAAAVIPVCAAYNLLKLESWNPYKLHQDYQLLEMKRIEESPPDLVHALVVPKTQLYFFTDILPPAYGYANRVFGFGDDAEGAEQLAAFLRSHHGPPVEVRTNSDSARIRALAESTGARFGPPVQDGIPPLTNERDRKIFPIFEALNP